MNAYSWQYASSDAFGVSYVDKAIFAQNYLYYESLYKKAAGNKK